MLFSSAAPGAAWPAWWTRRWRAARPRGICISAIALETLSAAAAALTAHGLAAQVTQIAVSRTRPAGRLHLAMANNPVFLVTGNCE